MAKLFFVIGLILLIMPVSITANDDDTTNRFVERLIEESRESARKDSEILVVFENKIRTLIVFWPKDFKGILVNARQKKIGIDLQGKKFMFVDKEKGIIVKIKYPARYRSALATYKYIKISKDHLRIPRAKTVKTSSEFFEEFYKNAKRYNLDKKIFLDVRIYNYTSKLDFD